MSIEHLIFGLCFIVTQIKFQGTKFRVKDHRNKGLVSCI